MTTSLHRQPSGSHPASRSWRVCWRSSAQQFAEGTLLGLAERFRQNFYTVPCVAGESGGAVPRPTRRPVSDAAWPERLVQIAQLLAGRYANCFSAYPTRLGATRHRCRVGPRVSGNRAGPMPQLAWNSCSAANRHTHRTLSPYRHRSRLRWRNKCRGFSAPGPGSTGQLLGTPDASTAWRDSHARLSPRIVAIIFSAGVHMIVEAILWFHPLV